MGRSIERFDLRCCSVECFRSRDVLGANRVGIQGSTSDGNDYEYVFIDKWDRTFFVALLSVPAMMTSHG
jgi:hypothetical protein